MYFLPGIFFQFCIKIIIYYNNENISLCLSRLILNKNTTAVGYLCSMTTIIKLKLQNIFGTIEQWQHRIEVALHIYMFIGCGLWATKHKAGIYCFEMLPDTRTNKPFHCWPQHKNTSRLMYCKDKNNAGAYIIQQEFI